MIPLPKDIIAKDVTQWLGEGWFYAETAPSMIDIARLIQVNSEANKAYIQLLNKSDDSEIICEFNQLYAFWPECGALNIMPNHTAGGIEGKYAVHLSRLQKKQWKRTYNSYCLKLRVISDKPEDYNVTADYPQIVNAAFNPIYFDYPEALKKFKQGWRSVALNPSILVANISDSEHIVYADGEIIGVIKESKLTSFNPALKRRLLHHFEGLVE